MGCSRCKYLHECDHQCMNLPNGYKCKDCVHVNRCTSMFGAKEENTRCGFGPIRFVKKVGEQ